MTTSSEIDNTYMSVARIMRELSGDPDTQVGACIVDPKKNVIVSSGTNKPPDGCENFPTTKGDDLDDKHLYMVHAEANAIVKRGGDIEGCNLYSTLFPCNECAKLIIQSKIGKVFYSSRLLGKRFLPLFEAAERMFEEAGIPTIQL